MKFSVFSFFLASSLFVVTSISSYADTRGTNVMDGKQYLALSSGERGNIYAEHKRYDNSSESKSWKRDLRDLINSRAEDHCIEKRYLGLAEFPKTQESEIDNLTALVFQNGRLEEQLYRLENRWFYSNRESVGAIEKLGRGLGVSCGGLLALGGAVGAGVGSAVVATCLAAHGNYGLEYLAVPVLLASPLSAAYSFIRIGDFFVEAESLLDETGQVEIKKLKYAEVLKLISKDETPEKISIDRTVSQRKRHLVYSEVRCADDRRELITIDRLSPLMLNLMTMR